MRNVDPASQTAVTPASTDGSSNANGTPPANGSNEGAGAEELSQQDLVSIEADVEGTSGLTSGAATHLAQNPELVAKVDADGSETISEKEMAEFNLPLKMNELNASVRGDPAAQSAVDELVSNPNFKNASAETKMAILSQANNFPSERAISNLNRTQGQQWFQDMSLDDQQRSLVALGYMSSDPNSSQEIVDNTLDHLIGEDARFSMAWEAIGEDGTAAFVDSSRPDTIFMNSDKHAEAGNWEIAEGQGDAAGDLFTNAIAHETNHLLNNDTENVSTAKDLFEIEVRAWRVGFEAGQGRHPTNQETGERALRMLGLDGDPAEYAGLGDVFATKEYPLSREAITKSLIDIWGRGDISLQEIVTTDPDNVPGASSDLGVINENDPNNLDNSASVA